MRAMAPHSKASPSARPPQLTGTGLYRIQADRITGRHATLEPVVPTETALSMTDVVEGGRLQRGLRLALGKLRR
jgi:hypothetical protein